jgi:hypothetical protein
VTKLLSKSCETLPSPSQLKGKILLKCKKLPKQESDEIVESYDSEQEMDLCDSIKNGKMYIQGVGSQWEPYFFALFNDKLIYTEIDEDKDGDNDNNIPSFADSYRRVGAFFPPLEFLLSHDMGNSFSKIYFIILDLTDLLRRPAFQ